MKDNRVCLIKLNYPRAELTRNGTRKYHSRSYFPTAASWLRLEKVINNRIKSTGVEFNYVDKAEVLF